MTRLEDGSSSEQMGHAFFQDADVLSEFLLVGQLGQQPWRLVHRLEGQFEAPIMHGDKPSCAQFTKNAQRFVRAHMNVAEGIRVISANREQSNLRLQTAADLGEAFKVGAISRVIEGSPLMS